MRSISESGVHNKLHSIQSQIPLQITLFDIPSFHQVTLNSYTFESVAFHVLHERIPLYTFRTLSDWWDSRTALNRWRTVDHYVKRCRGNVRILESLDFIGRTSELARLFGILFFSVISRGSQVFPRSSNMHCYVLSLSYRFYVLNVSRNPQIYS